MVLNSGRMPNGSCRLVPQIFKPKVMFGNLVWQSGTAMQTADGSAAQREAIVAFKDLEFQYEAKMAYWNDILERERVKLWQSVFHNAA